jgi:lysozyme
MTAVDLAALRDQTIREEGPGPMKNGRYFPYVCPAGKTTIGWGFNIEDVGISAATVEQMWNERANEVLTDLRSFAWFSELDPVRQRALFDMRYVLGPTKFRRFRKFLAAMGRHDYPAAKRELLDSHMSRDIPGRTMRMAKAIERGQG